MARPLRIEKAGGWYHITSRGNERKPIFRDARDRRRFLELIGGMVSRFRVRLHLGSSEAANRRVHEYLRAGGATGKAPEQRGIGPA